MWQLHIFIKKVKLCKIIFYIAPHQFCQSFSERDPLFLGYAVYGHIMVAMIKVIVSTIQEVTYSILVKLCNDFKLLFWVQYISTHLNAFGDKLVLATCKITSGHVFRIFCPEKPKSLLEHLLCTFVNLFFTYITAYSIHTHPHPHTHTPHHHPQHTSPTHTYKSSHLASPYRKTRLLVL